MTRVSAPARGVPVEPEDPWISARARISRRYLGGPEAIPDGPLDWAGRYRRINGRPFSLERFEPLRAIYVDDHPRKVVMKPAQRGVSEYAVNLACFALEYGARRWVGDAGPEHGLNVLYVFPVQQALNDFSKERISGLKQETTHLEALFGDDTFDSLGFKQVGTSYLYLRGGWSESALLSLPADVLILDEYDRMDPKAIALARRRMNASEVRREVAISTPTIPGRGIHAAYLATDRRVYRTPCPDCDDVVSFDFFNDVTIDGEPHQQGWELWGRERIETGTIELCCPYCRHPFTDAERCAPGVWEAERPEITGSRGYHVPWWPFPFVDLRAFALSSVSQDPDEAQEFYRSDLGLPYTATGSAIDFEQLAKLSAGLPNGQLPPGPWRDTTLGADIGSRLHYRVSSTGPDGLVYVRAMGSVRNWSGADGLDQLMTTYGVQQAVIDAQPELHEAAAFCERWKGRALRAFYPHGATALRGTLFNVKKETAEIQINRTMAMDRVYANVAARNEVWPGSATSDPEVIEHLTAPTRVVTIDNRGQEQATWVHTRPDHLFHASVYDLVARETLPRGRAFSPAVGGERGLLKAYDAAVGRREGLLPGQQRGLTSRHGTLTTIDNV